MGSAASSRKMSPEVRSTLRHVTQDAASNNIIGRPLDASDLTTMEEALEEVKKLRKFANDTLGKLGGRASLFDPASLTYKGSLVKEIKANPGTVGKDIVNGSPVPEGKTLTSGSEKSTINHSVHGREAVCAVNTLASLNDYIKKLVVKNEKTRELLMSSIKQNVLFSNCSQEELDDMVDAFECVEVQSGMTVIQQGDEGDHFYVIEKGSLDVWVKAEGERQSQLIDGASLVAGSSFGELALMYSKPRAATVVATEDTSLWCLGREDYHLIITYFKMYRMEQNIRFVGNVTVEGSILRDVLTPQELDHVAMSLERDSYKAGDIITRQGLGGDVMFILFSGAIDIFREQKSRKPSITMASPPPEGSNKEGLGLGKYVKTLKVGQYFGEKALLDEDVRDFSTVATADSVVLTLDRNNISDMIGSIQEIIAGKHQLDEADGSSAYANLGEKHCLNMVRDDVTLITVLGAGAFGKVILCKNKHNDKTYALKCQSKSMIIQNGLKSHVLNELHIMVQFDHPFIAMLHTVFQDNKYLYFVLELLQGGELFTHTRKFFKLEEAWAKFYSASVVLAYTQIHAHKVAYRDLKPENLVMDFKGYAKIVDFGLAKVIESGKTWTICGTPDYLAPEIITTEGHDIAVDYWSLGIFIYELSAGQPPFQASDPMETYEKILSNNLICPSHFSRGLQDIVKKLLQVHQMKRLGNTKGGIHSIMTHKWFSGFDWEGIFHQRFNENAIPIKPSIDNPEDASAFEPWDPTMDMDSVPDCLWSPELPDMFKKHTMREMAKKENEQRMSEGA